MKKVMLCLLLAITIVSIVYFVIDDGGQHTQPAVAAEDPYLQKLKVDLVSEIENYCNTNDRFQVDVSFKEAFLLLPYNGDLDNSCHIHVEGGVPLRSGTLGMVSYLIHAVDSESSGENEEALAFYKKALLEVSLNLLDSISSSIERVKGKLQKNLKVELSDVRNRLINVMKNEPFDSESVRDVISDYARIKERQIENTESAGQISEIDDMLESWLGCLVQAAATDERLFGCEKALSQYLKIMEVFGDVNLPSVLATAKYVSRCQK